MFVRCLMRGGRNLGQPFAGLIRSVAMILKAVIIRVDGAFAELEELRHASFKDAFSEAGFNWDIDREKFAALRVGGSLRDAMRKVVQRSLKRGVADCTDELIGAMHRHARKTFNRLLAENPPPPRAGIRELIVALRHEGVPLALVGALSADQAARLLASALGTRGPEAFDVISLCSEDEVPCDAGAMYAKALADLSLPPEVCLVIEATHAGANAATALGLPVLITRNSHFSDVAGSRSELVTFENLTNALPVLAHRRHEPMDAVEFANLIAALEGFVSGSTPRDTAMKGTDAMRVAEILKLKGNAVQTIEATATVRRLAQDLRDAAVGAMVVKTADGGIQGIVTERDLSRGIAEYASDLPSMPVSALMTKSVITCSPEDTLEQVATTMTNRRIRHLPVTVAGRLVGLVSIGDVLKHRLDEVELEANVLRDFALARK